MEHDYQLNTCAPLAECRKVETEEVVAGLRRVRPLALEVYLRAGSTVIESWQPAAKARDASKQYPAFAKYLYPACARFLENGEP